jgi:hypothetical protein
VVQPADPRELPAQDAPKLDREEQAASVLTRGIGLVAGATMLILLIITCGRWVF